MCETILSILAVLAAAMFLWHVLTPSARVRRAAERTIREMNDELTEMERFEVEGGVSHLERDVYERR